MSKFKIGDKVRVKYIPAVYVEYDYNIMTEDYPEFGEIRTVTNITNGGYRLDEPNGFWFSDDSLRLVKDSEPAVTGTTQRTLLGLADELHLLEKEFAQLWKKICGLRDGIQKIMELGE